MLVNNGGLLHVSTTADTLDVTGTFQITTTAAPHFGSLSAGYVILRNVTSYFEGYQGSGTNTVVCSLCAAPAASCACSKA